MSRYTYFISSPLGPLEITSTEKEITGIRFIEHPPAVQNQQLPAVLSQCVRQLKQYFSGELRSFDLPMKPSGTDFQQKVWEALTKIPPGTTVSYLELAEALGDPKAIRAVAAANGKNPIPIVIPCHRVIGSDGSLVGFAGGLEKKEWLLYHEGALSQYKLFSAT